VVRARTLPNEIELSLTKDEVKALFTALLLYDSSSSRVYGSNISKGKDPELWMRMQREESELVKKIRDEVGRIMGW